MNLKDLDLNEIEKKETPFLICDLEIIRQNYHRISKSISNVEVFYAMKANDHKEITSTLLAEGASFEIASEGELNQMKEFKVPPKRIACFNPVKQASFIRSLRDYGVKLLAFDSTSEVDKIFENAPESELLLRLQVDNEGSDWPLTNKFGVDVSEALEILKYARQKKLSVTGLTIHVGSQCLNKNNWLKALVICEEVMQEAKKIGFDFSIMSLGGGLPAQHTKPIPSVEEIGETINSFLESRFLSSRDDFRITIEPGRGLVGDSSIMVSSVVGVAKRGSENWVYLDVGVFNGLMETIEGFMYELKTSSSADEQITTIAGPSCDSVDVMFKDILFPKVDVGDKVYIINAGAYTTVYASRFNAFEIPKMYFLNKSV